MDQFYFEEGYIDASYYVYTAEAKVSAGPYIDEGYTDPLYYEDYSVTASLSCTAQILVGQEVIANGSWQSEFTTAITVNRIRDYSLSLSNNFSQVSNASKNSSIDLFAFSDAALSAQVDIIRDNNINVSSVFSIAVDYSRIRYISAEEPSLFSFSVINERSRATSMAMQAAFSLSAITNNRTRDQSVSCVTTATLYSNSGFRLLGSAEIEVLSTVTTSRYVGTNRPITVSGSFNGSELINAANRSPTDLRSLNTAYSWYFQTSVRVQRVAGSGDENFQNRNLVIIPNVLTIFIDRSASIPRTTLYVNGGGFVSTNLTRNDPNPFNDIVGVQYIDGQYSYYLNGTRFAQSTAGATTGAKNATVQFAPSFPFTVASTKIFHAFTNYSWLTVENITNGASSYTVSAPTNTENTVFLYNFNGNGNEEVAGTLFGASALSSNATINVSSVRSTSALANLSTSTALTCIISHIEGADLQAFTNGSLTTTAVRIKQLAVDISSEASMAVDANVVFDHSSNIQNDITFTTIVDRIRDVAIETTAVASQLTAVVRLAGLFLDDLSEFIIVTSPVATKTFSTAISTSSTIVCDNTKVRFYESSISSNSNLITESDVRKVAEANVSSAFTLTTDFERFRALTANLAILSSIEIYANNLGKIEGTLFNNCSLSVDAVKLTDISENYQNSSSLIANNDRIRDNNLQFNSEYTQNTLAVKTAEYISNISAMASELTIGVKTARTISLIVDAISLIASANTTANANSNNIITSTIAISANINAVTSSNLICQSSITADAIAAKLASADLSAIAFTLTAAVRIASQVGDLECQSTLIAQPTVIRQAVSDITAQNNISIDGQRIRFGNAIIAANTGININAGITYFGQANITSAMSYVVQIRDLRIDEIEYVIPAEIWVYDIAAETRLYTIKGETRLYTIK